MISKPFTYIGISLGMTTGGALPLLWGVGAFSSESLLGLLIGGMFGIWAGYKLNQYIG